MYRIGTWAHFSSAHYLRNYCGKCEHLHGHNWKVEIVLEGDTLDAAGMLIDFGIVKKHLNAVLDELDHKCLNDDIPAFAEASPSSENIASFVYAAMADRVRGTAARMYEVKVFESENCYAIYRRP